MNIFNRFSIAAQLTILAVIVAVGAIVILSGAVLDEGRRVLLTHEIMDLGDEANLRVYELRDQIRYFQWQLRGVARKVGIKFHDQLLLKATPTAALRHPRVLEEWRKEWDLILQNYPKAEPDTEQKSRQDRDRIARRYIDAQTVREAYWYQLGETNEQCRLLAVWQPKTESFQFDRLPEVPDSVKFLATKDFFFEQTPAFSHPRLERVTPDRDELRCFVTLIVPIWVVDNEAHHALIVRLDLTQYFINLAERAPRHYFILTDHEWRLLVHPQPSRVGKFLWDDPEGKEVWHFRMPRFDEKLDKPESWLPPFNTETEQRMLNSSGRRLRPPGLMPDKGIDEPTDSHFNPGDRYRFYLTRKELPVYQAELFEEINQYFREQSDRINTTTYPTLRFVELNQEAKYILLSHQDRGTLQQIERQVDSIFDAWNAKLREKGEPPIEYDSWSKPIECQEFTAHLVRSRLSSYAGQTSKVSDQESQFQLILLASVEEIQDDIEDAIQSVRMNWGLRVLLGAGGLALLSALWLTRPLKRITEASEKLASGEYHVNLKVRGPKEVNKLATSFTTMATQIRDRGDELNRNLERIQTILKTAAEGIIVFNNHGRILEANLAAVKMFGYSSEAEMKNRRADELLELPMKLSDPSQSSIHKKKDNESVHVFDEVLRMPSEIRRGVREDGTPFWIEVGFSKIASQRLYTGIFRDVSARKEAEEMRVKAEKELKDLNSQLDHRVSERTAELAEAKDRLEVALEQSRAAMKAKDTFVANMSHELRQPLHIIIGFTEALRDEMEDEGNTTVVKDLNKIHAAAKHLLDLINDLLDLAKIAAGKMDLSISDFDLPILVETLRTLAQPLIEKNENTLVVNVDPECGKMRSDERRVKQVLFNLMSNAAKFTSKGRVELKVSPERLGAHDGFTFRVIDSGKGMSPEQRSRLFQRFYQVDDSTTRAQGGTGLGLAITQSLCELMKGTIDVKSEVGVGSEFIVWLPRDATPEDATALRGQEPRSKPTIALPPVTFSGEGISKVLVVDDDDRVRELMERFLLKEGFQVITAPNGVEGLRLAKEHHPCVITLDVMMPGIDGWGILAALKTDASTQDIPVVIVSIVDDRNRGFALGASDYINKPIDWPRLGSILRRHIREESREPVLVIDDDVNVRGLVVRFLEKEGFNVTQAENGRQGLEQFRARRPAAILLDVNMPVMDGFQFVDELRKLDPTREVPVIVLTGQDLSAAEQQRLSGGVSQILQKGEPENLDALLNLLHREIREVLAATGPKEATPRA